MDPPVSLKSLNALSKIIFSISKSSLKTPNEVWNALKFLQKQPPEVFCQNRCSWKLRNIHKKTPALESIHSLCLKHPESILYNLRNINSIKNKLNSLNLIKTYLAKKWILISLNQKKFSFWQWDYDSKTIDYWQF